MERQVTIAREAGFSFAGFVAGQGFRFLFNLVVASLLGAESLGVYALSLAVIQIAEVLAVGGLGAGVLRFVNLYEAKPDQQRGLIAAALKSSLFFSLPLVLLLVVFSGFLSAMVNGDDLLRLTLVCYACSVPFHVLIAVAGHAVQAYGKLQPKIIAGQILVPGGMLLLFILINAFAGGSSALLFSLPLSALAGFVWIWTQLRAITGVSARDIVRAKPEKEMVRYARPLMLVAVMGMVSHWLDILMLGWYSGTETVGLYQPAVRTAGLMRSVLLAFAGITAPIVAGMHGRGEIGEIEKLLRVVTRWVMILAVPLAVVLLVMPATVLALFGGAFTVAAPVLIVLAAAVLVQSVFGLYDTVLQMSGYSKLCVMNGAASLAVHILLNMVLISSYGMIGAAWALLAVYFFLGVTRAAEVRALLGIHAFSVSLIKPLVAGIISGLVLSAVKPFLVSLSVAVSLGGGMLLVLAIYLLLIRLMQLEQDEKDVILRLFSFVKKT